MTKSTLKFRNELALDSLKESPQERKRRIQTQRTYTRIVDKDKRKQTRQQNKRNVEKWIERNI